MGRTRHQSSGWTRKGTWYTRTACAAAIAAMACVMPAGNVAAHETDQHTLPEGREFADIGPVISRWHYEAIQRGVDKVNAQIKAALDAHNEDEVRSLEEPDHLVRVVNKEFPWAMDVIEGWDKKVRSQEMADEFPGHVVGYKHPFVNIYQHTHFILDPRQAFRVWLGATFRCYGHNIGTDKVGHFTDEGMNYYNVYYKARKGGDDEQTAIRKAIHLGTDDFLLGEKGMLGLLTAGDYSNGDLVSNWLGFSFYRNLTEPWSLEGRTQPAMCVRDGPYWRVAPHVRPDNDFFRAFVCDGEDEALNPGHFETLMHNPLRSAIRDRRERVLQYYVDEHGCRRPKWWFDQQLEKWQTYYGLDYGHSGSYDQLIAIGNTLFENPAPNADVRHRDASGQTPLHTAAWAGDANLVRTYLSRGADPNAQVRSDEQVNNDWGSTPLHFACASGSVDVVRQLIAAGADVNARNDLGVTPLHRAVRFPAVARLLIDRGAKVDVADARGRTPLHWAACDAENCQGVAAELLASGANVDVRDHDGRTPLHLAAAAGRDDVAGELLRRSADVNAPDQFRETPLHLAAAKKFSPIADVLVRAGAKVNVPDDFGCTPLFDAARVGAADNVALLLRAGASPAVADAFGRTPLQVARERGSETVVAELPPTATVSADVSGAQQAGYRRGPSR